MSSDEFEIASQDASPQTFRQELAAVINRHSKENGSNTPDFILAGFLNACLEAYEIAVSTRRAWSAPVSPDEWAL